MIQYTKNQQKVIDCDDRIILVDSVAGSGKTTTLQGLFEKHKDKRILYLVYNKSMSNEAKATIKLKNVDIFTFHALAFKKVNVSNFYKHRLSTSYTLVDIIEDLELDKNQKGVYSYAKLLRLVWNTFIKSGHRRIMDLLDTMENQLGKYSKEQISEDIQKIFNIKQDIKSTSKIEHDFYAFLYFLCEDPLSEYDILAVDEAQDSSEIILDIFNRFHGKKIAVGDKRQNIYGFNNTINLFERVKGATVLDLPESHRVSQAVADICSIMYKKYLNQDESMVGLNPNNVIVNAIDTSEKYVMLCRNNCTIFQNAIVGIEMGKKMYFEGGVEGCRFNQYLDFFFFKKGVKRKNFSIPILNQLDDWQDFVDYIAETQDEELTGIINIVNQYGDQLPALIDEITKKASKTKSAADIIFSTIHKSKGLTFNVPLKIADDVKDIHEMFKFYNMIKYNYDLANKILDEMREEINVIYVAVTRGKDLLQLPDRIKRMVM